MLNFSLKVSIWVIWKKRKSIIIKFLSVLTAILATPGKKYISRGRVHTNCRWFRKQLIASIFLDNLIWNPLYEINKKQLELNSSVTITVSLKTPTTLIFFRFLDLVFRIPWIHLDFLHLALNGHNQYITSCMIRIKGKDRQCYQ